MHREKNQLRAATSLPKATRGFDPIHTWHGNVESHHVGIQLCGGIEQVQSIADRADDFKPVGQQRRYLPEQGWMVIRQQQARDFWHGVHKEG